MIYGKLVSNAERIDEVNKILNEVFNEMNCIDKDIFDISDKQVFHALLYEGLNEEEAVATGRMIIENNNAYVKWVAVRKEYRRKLYGDMIVRMLIDKAKSLSIENIYAEVPVYLTDMFKKIGFDLYLYKDEKNSMNEKNYIIMRYGNRKLNCCQNTQK